MSKTEEEVRVEMGMQEGDAAIIFKANGELHVVLPDHEPDEIMPPTVLGAVAIARRLLTDPKWAQEIIDWYDTQTEKEDALRAAPPVGGVH
jgi:hypothetical protein